MAPSTVPPKARLSHGISRTREMCVDAGVTPASSGKFRARTAKTMPTAPWRISLAFAFRPRLRCCEILMKSSRKPTSPMPTMRNSSSRAEADGPGGRGFISHMIRWVSRSSARTARMTTVPPMVGVPRLVWCEVGPSSRMNCP